MEETQGKRDMSGAGSGWVETRRKEQIRCKKEKKKKEKYGKITEGKKTHDVTVMVKKARAACSFAQVPL